MTRYLRSVVVKNAIFLYGIQFTGYVLPLFTFPYVARVLGLEKFGLINWAAAVVSYFQVLTEYGFNFSVTRKVALNRHDPEKLCRIYSSSMAARALLLLLSLLILTALVQIVPKMRAQQALFYISFLTVVGYAAFPQWLFQGLEKMGWITARELAARFAGLMTIFFLVKTKDDYLWAAAVMAGSTAAAGIVGLLCVRSLTGVRFVTPSAAEVKETLIEGFHVFLSTAAMSFYTRANLVMIGFVANEAVLGAFTAALRVADAAKSLVFPLSTAVYPHVSRAGARSRDEVVQFISRNVFRVTAPFFALSLGLIVWAPKVIGLLYGDKYQDAIPLLRVMAPIPLIVALTAPYATYYILGLGLNSAWLRIVLAAGAMNVASLLLFLWLFSPSTAAAAASTMTEALVLSMAYFYFRRHQTSANHVEPDLT